MSKLLRDGIPRKNNGKIDLTPKTHHAHSLLLMILGFLLPPLAVAARFGIGKDFFLNCILTICGYIPGHGHNFFIQNIRDNRNRNRTPKWAIRYGLVDTNYLRKRQKKRQWAGRYNDTMPNRTMYDEDGNEFTYEPHHRFEDGDQVDSAPRNRSTDSLIDEDRYYNAASPSAASPDPYSLRKSRSNVSGQYTGKAERSNARSKSRSRALLGRKKADRNAKAGEVMCNEAYGRAGSRGGCDNGASMSSSRSGSRHSFEGPEDADAHYKPSASNLSSRAAHSTRSPVSSSRRRANDGLDHTF